MGITKLIYIIIPIIIGIVCGLFTSAIIYYKRRNKELRWIIRKVRAESDLKIRHLNKENERLKKGNRELRTENKDLRFEKNKLKSQFKKNRKEG